MSKVHKRKINWGNIPIIAKQREEKRKIRKALKRGKRVQVTFISGGAPGSGKR